MVLSLTQLVETALNCLQLYYINHIDVSKSSIALVDFIKVQMYTFVLSVIRDKSVKTPILLIIIIRERLYKNLLPQISLNMFLSYPKDLGLDVTAN